MLKFLRNALLLCLIIFPRNYILEEAVLIAEELYNTKTNPSTCLVTPCRSLAKSLLKGDRQVLILLSKTLELQYLFLVPLADER